MRILITGAAGFIGWNLSRALRERHPDAFVMGVDNLWTGVRRQGETVSVMAEMDAEHMSSAVPEYAGTFDWVYHLASPASPPKYQSNPIRTMSANIQGLLACFEMMAPGGSLLFTSSSEIYGDPLVSPQPETYRGQVNCVGPRACYDESKRVCETLCYEYTRATGQVCKIARLFNVYGPGTLPDDGRAVSNFIWRSMRGLPIEIYGSGEQTRAFTYVDDVVGALVTLMEDTGHFTGPINIGTNIETTLNKLVVMVHREIRRWASSCSRTPPGIDRVSLLPSVVDDPRQRLPDVTLAEQILGWDTRRLVQLAGPDGGIQRTIGYFESVHLEQGVLRSDG